MIGSADWCDFASERRSAQRSVAYFSSLKHGETDDGCLIQTVPIAARVLPRIEHLQSRCRARSASTRKISQQRKRSARDDCPFHSGHNPAACYTCAELFSAEQKALSSLNLQNLKFSAYCQRICPKVDFLGLAVSGFTRDECLEFDDPTEVVHSPSPTML
jgi:hypothetical protein